MKASSVRPVPALERPIVERPRLTRLLDRTTARIILLAAPAGYGKTTLARQWLHGRKHAWYPCTAASSDVAGLALDLSERIIALRPDLERPLRMHLRVAAQASDQVEHLTEVLVEHFLEWPPDTLLAIDDYQLIAQSDESASLFAALVERTSVPFLITARHRPSWATARGILYGDLYELDQNALAITRAEAAKLLDQKAPAVARELAAISRGWPAILSLAWHADPRTLPRRSSPLPELLLEYITDEVFSSLPRLSQGLLPLFARAGELSETLLTAALGSALASALCGELESAGLKKPRSAEISLHPLLQTFLSSMGPIPETSHDHADALIDALSRIARWDDSFNVALACESEPLISKSITLAMRPLLDAGRVATLLKWIDKSVQAGHSIPLTVIARAELARRKADYRAAESLALHGCRSLPDNHPLHSFGLCIAGSSAHLSHNDKRALEHYAAAAVTARTTREREDLAWGQLVTAAALEHPHLSRFESSLRNSTDVRTPMAQLRLAAAQYVVGRASGSLARALEAAETALPLADECPDPMVTSVFLHSLAYMLAFAGRYDHSLAIADRALAHATRFRLSFVRSHVLATQALALVGLSKTDKAERIIVTVLNATHDRGARAFVEINTSILQARIALASRDFATAAALTSLVGRGIPEKGVYAELAAIHGLSLLGLKRHGEAIAAFQEASRRSHGAEAACIATAGEVLLLLLRPDTRVDRVDKLVSSIVGRGGGDIIVQCCRAFDEFADLARTSASCATIFSELLSLSHDESLAETLELPYRHHENTLSLATLLTNRELEIGELLSAGMSNKEIAERLVIAQSTVKVHLRALYRKLEVRTRTEAAVKLLRQPP